MLKLLLRIIALLHSMFMVQPIEHKPIMQVSRSRIVPLAPIANCGPHAMSPAEAHQCWDSLINQYSWDRIRAFRIMYCESKGNYAARNRHSSATGLMQELGGPVEPKSNIALAYQMYLRRGFQPWVCR